VTEGQQVIGLAIAEAESLIKTLKRLTTNQVRADDEKQLVRATALTWFNNRRPVLVVLLGDDQIKTVDDFYRGLIAAAGRATTRNRYVDTLKKITKNLGALQSDHVLRLAATPITAQATTPDAAPRFDPLITDPKMQAILTRRWQECVVCVKSGAPLAATVMMGGLLEGLLLAKINQLSNKAPVFSAAATPMDQKTGKALQLKEWGLKNYIDVAHELGWITKTTKDVGEVVRDYRNYIHPQKELSHGITLESGDAHMLWEVAKSITIQLLK
jgi:hypothetical protein